MTTVRTLRPVSDPRWGQAPPGVEIEVGPDEAVALHLAGLVEPPEPVHRRPEAATNERRERAVIPSPARR